MGSLVGGGNGAGTETGLAGAWWMELKSVDINLCCPNDCSRRLEAVCRRVWYSVPVHNVSENSMDTMEVSSMPYSVPYWYIAQYPASTARNTNGNDGTAQAPANDAVPDRRTMLTSSFRAGIRRYGTAPERWFDVPVRYGQRIPQWPGQKQRTLF